VDPDLAYRRFVRGVLAEYGFVVYEASSSAEALQLAIARRPWLILSEVNLPDQSGFDLCARIRSHGLLRRTPLAFLSDWDEPDKRYAGLQLGADDYLVKPITIRELVIRLELILKRYKDLRPGSQPGASFRGSVELVGAAGLLQVCHLNRLTGILMVRHGPQQIRVSFRGGEIVGATGVHLIRSNGNEPLPEEIVFTLLSWPRGQFQFAPAQSIEGQPIGEGFDQILLEGCRRLDERDLSRASGS
jgi:CheY-like chemotaxis protein